MLKPTEQRLNNNDTGSSDKLDSRNRACSAFVYHFLINDFDV